MTDGPEQWRIQGKEGGRAPQILDRGQLDPGAAEFGRRRRILCVSRKSAEKNSAKPYDKRRLSRRNICRLRVLYLSGI